MAGIRGTLKDTSLNIIEIAPPAVQSDFHAQYADVSKSIPGAMTMEDFVNEIFKQLNEKKPEDLKEVAAGSAQDRVDAWRAGTGSYMKKMGIEG